jgi:hypothetical protein
MKAASGRVLAIVGSADGIVGVGWRGFETALLAASQYPAKQLSGCDGF